ncbi:MAG: PEP-CTERM sorting domain-containing protein [Alphaproteobacteria bacterium]|nr:PEP-CTERM sorting domain-containing protein [Alphaproteobacteria bacterium]MBU1515950.1 PEP-CTERM sorting domain-containing protein [Alphaproteobacteria bacterium]MBU2092835.1 PEP-CTERM sorting domain-containing protein [Alphaproteobacteria bacterium]MBU2153640.1 PEP-CTERM sorting domain-containing protein [Alphaproteobacteria bacterium]MBU2308268.1 PEP-CTERM sorting domain-containing protein [Alphaproteobacteria bacterium]
MAAVLFAGAARAAPVLDQQALPLGGSFYEALEWQQTVTAGTTGRLSGITLYGAGTNVTVRVNAGDGFYSGPYAFSQAVQLASGGTFIDTSSADIQLAAGQRFVIDLINGFGGNISAAATPYPDGHLFLNFGAPSDVTACCNSGLAFQTFMDGDTAVPEPGAWPLMILGFSGAGAALRRRRAGFAPA